MAKYTMTLLEYLEDGHTLPTSFALIDGFADAFKAEYIDSEIGFETDELFAMKLEARAKVVMPVYADYIAKRTEYWQKLDNPTKTRTENGAIDYDFGKQKSKSTELPFDDDSAEPNVITESDAIKNKTTSSSSVTESGQNTKDVIDAIEYLNRDVNILIERCLKEFSSLFMGVY